MASPTGDNSVERSHSKSPDSRIDAEDLIDDATAHLEKISDYKTYCKVRHLSYPCRFPGPKMYNLRPQGLMDIALLSANANQLRHAMDLCAPYRSLLIVLISLSIILQVVASCLLLVERITCRKKDYVKCRWSVREQISSAELLIVHFQVQRGHWYPRDRRDSCQHNGCGLWRS